MPLPSDIVDRIRVIAIPWGSEDKDSSLWNSNSVGFQGSLAYSLAKKATVSPPLENWRLMDRCNVRVLWQVRREAYKCTDSLAKNAIQLCNSTKRLLLVLLYINWTMILYGLITLGPLCLVLHNISIWCGRCSKCGGKHINARIH
ncbi:hypothetical protein RHMOL_Rhmol10G0158700 [Rhododendron molle]|uniref:Uncharacterized protein n=1 Tax=Rhododendron molle TaxID=49168 RepID=A0ACC0M329_RHOML|nr:hypothetical protein RHMOL_Rhmol10G0158700 [Rhododendron molle]